MMCFNIANIPFCLYTEDSDAMYGVIKILFVSLIPKITASGHILLYTKFFKSTEFFIKHLISHNQLYWLTLLSFQSKYNHQGIYALPLNVFPW